MCVCVGHRMKSNHFLYNQGPDPDVIRAHTYMHTHTHMHTHMHTDTHTGA